jgi:hypothetical protein
MAQARPLDCGKVLDKNIPGTFPRDTFPNEKVADKAAILKSAFSINATPPPTTNPWTEATTGDEASRIQVYAKYKVYI